MITFNLNELSDIDKIIQRHIHTNKIDIDNLVTLISFTCNITRGEAMAVLGDNSTNGKFGLLDWEHIRNYVIAHARLDILFNYNLILLAENWRVLGYKTQREAVEGMKRRMNYAD